MNAGLSLTIAAHGLQVQLKSTILSKFSFELEPLPSPAEALIQYSKGELPHGEAQKHSLFTSVCLAARAIIRFLLCLSSAKLRAIVGIKLTAQQLGHTQDIAETESKLEGAPRPLAWRGPVLKRPVMSIIGHYQLRRCPHPTVFTEISRQPQLQFKGTYGAGKGSTNGRVLRCA